MIYDENGRHADLSLAQAPPSKAAGDAARPDRLAGRELGGSSDPVHPGALARAGVELVTDRRLAGLARECNRLVARLEDLHGGPSLERPADRVAAELGSVPDYALFRALKPGWRNPGATGVDALRAGSTGSVAQLRLLAGFP